MDTPTLEGPHVRLEPLTLDHLPALEAVVFDPTIWRYMVYPMTTKDHLSAWLDSALEAAATGKQLSWVTIAKAHDGLPDMIAGATRFLDLDLHNRTVEIGNTWLVEAFRGTRINAEAKLLQLTFAFETLDMLRVAFKTIYEGTFRNHMLMPDGSHRDSAWFSIIPAEWPDVKDLLTRRLNAPL